MTKAIQLTLFREAAPESPSTVLNHSSQKLPVLSEVAIRSPAAWPFHSFHYGIRELEPRWIDIHSLPMPALLAGLYRSARASNSTLHRRPSMTLFDAKKLLVQRENKILTLWGCQIWVEFKPKLERIDARWYDFWNGNGKFKEVVSELAA